jgi:hypothetical protein
VSFLILTLILFLFLLLLPSVFKHPVIHSSSPNRKSGIKSKIKIKERESR